MNIRRPRSILAVPVLLLAMTGLAACGSSDTSDSDGAGSDTGAPAGADENGSDSDASAPLALTADDAAAGKCAVPSAEILSGFDTAFAGTVTSIDGGTATLSVDEWYAGDDEASTATVTSPSKDLEDLLLAVDFEQGKSYLVSADGERVTLCGFTAEQTPELQALYDEAFTQ